MSRRLRILGYALALVLVALFWNAVWTDLDHSVLSRVPMLDEAFYLEEGARIAEGHLFPDAPFYMSSLYPYLVAATGSGRDRDENRLRIGDPPTGIRILQAVCWLGVILMLAAVGRRLIGGRLWWLPALLFLLYRPAAIMASSILLEMPLTFLVTVALYRLSCARDDRWSVWDLILIGVAIGLAALLRGVAVMVWLPAVLMVGRVDPRRLSEARWKPMLILTLALVTVLAPVVLHNSYHSGRPAGLSLNFGLNAYLGNGPGANGAFRGLKDFDVETDYAGVEYLSRKLERPVASLAEADRVWLDETLDHLRDNPLEFPRLWLHKLRMHFIGVEFPQISSYQSWTRYVPWLKPLILPWCLLSVLGLAGLVAVGWRDPRVRVWSLTLLLLVSVHSVFFVVSRYRLVMVPILAVLATLLISRFAGFTRRRRAVAVAALVAAVLLALPWGEAPLLEQLHAAGLRNEAVRWQHLGSGESDPAARIAYLHRAENLYRRSKAEVAFVPDTYRGLARVLFLLNEPEEAEAILIEGSQAVGGRSDLRDDLARLYLQQDKAEAAVPLLNIMVRESPRNPDYLHNYAVALAGTGRTAQAVEIAQRLIDVAPREVRGYIDLGVVLARLGRLEDARSVFEAGLEVQPRDAALQQNLQRIDALENN